MTIVDACVHHHWSAQTEVMDYMSRGWREYLGVPGSLPAGAGAIPILPGFPYKRPGGDRLPGEEDHGSQPEAVCRRVFDRDGAERAVLCMDEGMLTPATPNTHLAREIARAANDWAIDRWLEHDPRLYGLVLVPNQVAEHAVAEIERVGDHPKMAGVLMCANGLGKPFGHPAYHPIYAAAAERGPPVVVHADGEAISETLSSPTAGGLPASWAEYEVFRPQALMTHYVTLVAQGVFDKYPGLRVLFSGGGATWLPSVLWRFETEYRTYRREAPWMTRTPTEYTCEHIRVCTRPLERTPDPETLMRLLRCHPQLERILVYGSGYPAWDTQDPDDVSARIPAEWRARVMGDNARELFRWAGRPAEPPRARELETMPVSGV
jgi:uncharacterized protein